MNHRALAALMVAGAIAMIQDPIGNVPEPAPRPERRRVLRAPEPRRGRDRGDPAIAAAYRAQRLAAKARSRALGHGA